MRTLRKIAAKTFAITTVATAVVVMAVLTARIVLDTEEQLKEGAKTPLNIAEVFVKEADSNDLRLIATAMAIAAGVAIAWHKLDIFREFEPHLTIEQTIQSQTLGDSYCLIVATAILRNNSKVLIKPREGYCRLAQISPLGDFEVIEIYMKSLRRDGNNLEQLGWPILGEVRRIWGDGDIAIEPGECQQETYQFIVNGDTESVVALTAFYNPSYGEGVTNGAETWRCYTFHAIHSPISARSE